MKDMLTSRKFWVAVLAVAVIVIAAFVPGFDLEVDTAAGMAVIVVAYLVGVAVDPGPGGWRGIIASRKFWAALVGFVIIFLDAFHIILPFGLTPEILVTVCVVIGGYIAGVALEIPTRNRPF